MREAPLTDATELQELRELTREFERALAEIAETTKGYPNASREGQIARRALGLP